MFIFLLLRQFFSHLEKVSFSMSGAESFIFQFTDLKSAITKLFALFDLKNILVIVTLKHQRLNLKLTCNKATSIDIIN